MKAAITGFNTVANWFGIMADDRVSICAVVGGFGCSQTVGKFDDLGLLGGDGRYFLFFIVILNAKSVATNTFFSYPGFFFNFSKEIKPEKT